MVHHVLGKRQRLILVLIAALYAAAAFLAACGRADLSATPTIAAPTGTHTPVPATASATASPSASITPSQAGARGVWENFPAPRLTPATPIPPPLSGLAIPEEVRVLVVAGADRNVPYLGRTDAIALVIYHPRLARASVVSVPPDLYAYLPGYTMQRMYIAYPLGGPRMLDDALEYNLGVRPDEYAIFNLDSFSELINDLGGIQVTVLENVVRYCPGLIPGVVRMNGDQALCYMRLRLGKDEFSRNRRQQEILRTVFLRLVEGGNLVRVPDLYNRYRSSIDSNLTLEEITGALPLALKLGDPSRIGYFQMGSDELRVWKISEDPEANVFLPNRPALMKLMQQAVNYVTTPSPLSDVVVTLEYQLTVSPTPTVTSTHTLVPTRTIRPSFTPVRAQTATPSTSTPTVTVTVTITPESTWTQVPTRTPTP